MNADSSEEMKEGARTRVWALVPAIASLLFSAATAWLTFLYLNAHDVAYHQPGRSIEYQLQPDLVHNERLLSSLRVVAALIAVILAAFAFRAGPRLMAWLSLIIGVLALVSITFFTMM